VEGDRTLNRNGALQTDDIKMRLRVNEPAEKDVLPPDASQEQQGPPPDVSYSAICKERLENEANDEVLPRCSHSR
jgi:hypothetical protein